MSSPGRQEADVRSQMIHHLTELAHPHHAHGTLRQMLLETACVGLPENPERIGSGIDVRFDRTHAPRYANHP
ncbi:hypothetical protein [Streptomyces sp. NPDC002913]